MLQRRPPPDGCPEIAGGNLVEYRETSRAIAVEGPVAGGRLAKKNSKRGGTHRLRLGDESPIPAEDQIAMHGPTIRRVMR